MWCKQPVSRFQSQPEQYWAVYWMLATLVSGLVAARKQLNRLTKAIVASISNGGGGALLK
jgi:hypothetical protein